MSVVLLGMAALAVDVGAMFVTRTELMAAADSAALASVTYYTTDEALSLGSDSNQSESASAATQTIIELAQEFGFLNTSLGSGNLIVESSDIESGWFDFDNPTAPITTGGPVSDYNAVQVTVRRTKSGPNGPLDLFFARIFGKNETEIIGSATAAFNDRFAAFVPSGQTTPLSPLALQQEAFEQAMQSGPDDFGYDPDLDVVTAFGDGVLEVRLFPNKEFGDGDGIGSGNFGLLNIGSPNQGVPELREQFTNGITAEEFAAEFGSSQLTFFDENGASVEFPISGTPGMHGGIASAVEARIGDVVGFFLFSTTAGTGANTVYTAKTLRFGRIVDVVLTGPPEDRAIVIQPTIYTGGEIVTDPSAPSSGGLVGNLMLVR